jgi:hypothetical protein
MSKSQRQVYSQIHPSPTQANVQHRIFPSTAVSEVAAHDLADKNYE